MADAAMYDPKNVAGITTLYVTPTKESPIYLKAVSYTHLTLPTKA